jgi:hypothetical protein
MVITISVGVCIEIARGEEEEWILYICMIKAKEVNEGRECR